MGYTTEFNGQFNLNKKLTKSRKEYLLKFAETRRMKRDPKKAEKLDDEIRRKVGLPIGEEAEYFVGGLGFYGQDRDESVVEYNSPPKTQPRLWCQWIPNDDGTALIWDGKEKFYEYVTWIKYLINNFLEPWGYVLNGTVEWRGESFGDTGCIVIENNQVSLNTTSSMKGTHAAL